MSTQVNMSGTVTEGTSSPVVAVGVDGSVRNRAAIEWAHDEAKSLGARLVLVGASSEYTAPAPRSLNDGYEEFIMDVTRKTLDRVRAHLSESEDDVSIVVGAGGARSVLLRAANHADILVVGKRGLGAVKRMLVGSNSIAVAGRSPIPVVVIPDDWAPSTTATAPIVMGLDGSRRDDAVLEYGFRRAGRLDVPLMVVRAWQAPAVYSWSPEDIGRWDETAKQDTSNALGPWTQRYPDVEVVTLTQDANPATALLDAAGVAQLVVLGRHTGPRHIGGFHLGSTSRAVLHYAECPIAIIPADHDEPGLEDDPSPSIDIIAPLYWDGRL